MKRQIAVVLSATLLIGTTPAWAGETTTATAAPRANDHALRDSVDRAVERVLAGNPAKETTAEARPEPGASGPELTANERRDLDRRREALRTDPVARGTGGIILLVVGIVASIAITAWAIDHYSNDNTDTTQTPAMGRR